MSTLEPQTEWFPFWISIHARVPHPQEIHGELELRVLARSLRIPKGCSKRPIPPDIPLAAFESV